MNEINVFTPHYTKDSSCGVKLEAYRLPIAYSVLNEERRNEILTTCYESLLDLYTKLTEDKIVDMTEKHNFISSVICNIDSILNSKSDICQHLEQEQIVLTRSKDDIRTAALIIIALLTDENTETYQFTSDVQLFEKSKQNYQLVDPFSDCF